MKTRILCLLALAPALLEAQIVLYSLSGITPSPLGSVYGYGQVAAGDLEDVRFRALNTGIASVTITLLKVINNTGAGFSIVNSSSTPFVIAPGNSMDFFVRFSATDIAKLQRHTRSGHVRYHRDGDPSRCHGGASSDFERGRAVHRTGSSTGPSAFGRITQGYAGILQPSRYSTPFPQALTVAPLTVTGAAFTTTSPDAVTIAAGQSVSFTIQFAPVTDTSSFLRPSSPSATRTYTLSGTGFTLAPAVAGLELSTPLP